MRSVALAEAREMLLGQRMNFVQLRDETDGKRC